MYVYVNNKKIKSLAYEVLNNYYKAISNKNITVFLEIKEISRIDMGMFSWSRKEHEIRGLLSKSILDNENLESIIKGVIAHELSHIARKHTVGWKYIFKKYLVDNPETLKAFHEVIEKDADNDVISRGLEKDLYVSKVYFESIVTNGFVAGYTSKELQNLISKPITKQSLLYKLISQVNYKRILKKFN